MFDNFFQWFEILPRTLKWFRPVQSNLHSYVWDPLQAACYALCSNNLYQLIHVQIRAGQQLKFIYSEKATKFCEIFTLSYVVLVKSMVKISQNIVALSEYMNFSILTSRNLVYLPLSEPSVVFHYLCLICWKQTNSLMCARPPFRLHAMLGFAAKCLPAARNYFAVVWYKSDSFWQSPKDGRNKVWVTKLSKAFEIGYNFSGGPL